MVVQIHLKMLEYMQDGDPKGITWDALWDCHEFHSGRQILYPRLYVKECGICLLN